MPKMPEVTVHVTTEPDPQEAREYKASADMWAEQCRTLQRTLLDTQIERDALRVRLAELEAILRRVDVYFQHTGKVGDLPVSVHALLPKLIHRHEDGTETAVTPLPMWQP